MPDTPPPLILRPARFANRVRVRGLSEAAYLFRRRAVDWWLSSETLILFVRSAVGAPPQTRTDLELRAATWADAETYARDIGTESPASFKRRLAHDVRCFLVMSDGRAVHSSWVTTTAAWTREIDAYITPPPGDAYLYESFTASDQRGRGIYPFALGSILHLLGRDGIAELWVGVESSNAPSIRAIRKGGLEEGFRLPYGRRQGRVTRRPATGPRAASAPDLVQQQQKNG